MTIASTTRVLDSGGPLFLHERPPYEPMPACGRGVCVDMPDDVAAIDEPFVVALRLMERHDGGPADVELERFHVAVSLTNGQCSAQDPAAARLLDERPWIPAALASRLDDLRRRAQRILARRDRSSYRAALDHATPGTMLPYDRLFPHDWDLLVSHKQRLYWATDQHCPNPACSCRETIVTLYDLHSADTPIVGKIRIDLTSDRPRPNASSPAAEQLFEPLWAQHGTELTRRSDEFRRAVVAHAASLGNASRFAAPSRNGPCPCGSGKKFKRCCATRDPSAASPPTGAAR
jgi:SEC-C motif